MSELKQHLEMRLPDDAFTFEELNVASYHTSQQTTSLALPAVTW